MTYKSLILKGVVDSGFTAEKTQFFSGNRNLS